jgi:hypothetical protein
LEATAASSGPELKEGDLSSAIAPFLVGWQGLESSLLLSHKEERSANDDEGSFKEKNKAID